jgi:3-hydroxyisobutyrate dehydrogenase-like beta-hydroxyacid dehydrogenase
VQIIYDSIIKQGPLPVLDEERLFIDTSTIDLETSKSIAHKVRTTLSAEFVDAPISGGVVGARAGSLTFMFGMTSKKTEQLQRIKSVLGLMGKEVWHMGAQGAGLSSKLANNYILAINNIATAEALNMGVKSGLDLKELSALISQSTGYCWPITVNNPVPGVIENSPASEDYVVGGSVSIINKDLRLAMMGAEAVGAKLTLAEKATSVYDDVEQVYRGKDLSVLYKWLQDRSET